MALGKLDHMDFTVGDLDKVEDYFTKKMGFKFLRRIEHQDNTVSAEFEAPAGDFVIQIHQGTEEQLKNRRERAPEWSLFFNHIAFKVDDINKEFKELESKGVSFKTTAPKLNAPTGRILANSFDDEGRHWIQLTD